MSTTDHLIIPVLLEKNLALPDGSTEGGYPVAQALQLDQSQVANLYSTSDKELKLSFQEHGVAYNETSTTDCLVETTVKLIGGESAGLSMTVDPTPVVMWGVNFAGRVIVKHKNGAEKEIYLPGTRTYDPAGLTGMSHSVVCLLAVYSPPSIIAEVMFVVYKPTHKSLPSIINFWHARCKVSVYTVQCPFLVQGIMPYR